MSPWHWILHAVTHRLLVLRVWLSGPDAHLRCTLCGEPFHLEVAHRPATLALGLAGRPRLAPNHGLLLVLPLHQEPGAISTLFMQFPLDLVFLDPAGHVVHAAQDVKQDQFPGVPVPADAVTVLELPSGTATRIGLDPGTQVPPLARARLPCPGGARW